MRILIVVSGDGDTTGMYKVNQEMVEKIQQVSKDLDITLVNKKDLNLEKDLEADILISNDLSILTAKNTKNLKWVHVTSAGTNKLPEFLKGGDVLITNSSGVHPIPISDHVFGLMLMLSRKLNLALRFQIQKKSWVRNYGIYQPGELFGKELLIVGMGRIGERIGEIGKAFGMKPIGIVRDLKKPRQTKVELHVLEELPQLVRSADFVVNCLPGIPSTRGIFNLEVFKKFKPTSYIINIGRGATFIERDLIKALKSGMIAGAGLDVFETEPLSDKSELWRLGNVIITPHYSGWTPKYTERVIDIFIKNLKAYLKEEKMPNSVDKKLGY